MVSPILLIVAMSFTGGDSLQFPPPAFSLRWYKAAWSLLIDSADASRLRDAILTSLSISSTTMVISALAGAPAAYALARYDLPGKWLVETFLALPLAFPLVVLGISFLVIVSVLGIEFGFLRIVIAHVILTIPFVIRNAMIALGRLPRSHEEAARILGASPLRVAVEIVVPAMWPGILAGMLLAFIISFNEFTVAYFLYTVDVFPVSIWIFSKSNTILDPTIFSISAIVIVFDMALIGLLDRLTGRHGVSV
jgi:putative spermidine/putrescine transport system permease protein